jgi:hypothetical protein
VGIRSRFIAIILTCATGCGWLNAGNTAVGLEPRPDGDVIGQGNLVGLYGSTVTGVVTLYRLTGGNSLVLRIEGLSISPSENTFRLIGEASGGQDFVSNLRFISGNANYPTSLQFPSVITRVIIESLSRPPPREVASAALTSP